MKLEGYYSSGQFARLANVSVRTIRFYDAKNILKPSYIAPSGARFYTDSDLARLQQILLLKYLGFSLDDIQKLTIKETDLPLMVNSLRLQKKLIQDRIEQMEQVEQAIDSTIEEIRDSHEIDWSHMLHLIHLTNRENRLRRQYQDASNINARIRLHRNYSVNPQGWFPWIFQQCHIKDHAKILELGCGNGALWYENIEKIPPNCHIILSDISSGMLSDARRNIGKDDPRFTFEQFDCQDIPYDDHIFHLILANHLLFYLDETGHTLSQVCRTLLPDGTFVCSTYGRHHMREISELVTGFDRHITLSDEILYYKFGLENGKNILSEFFSSVECIQYEDAIEIHDPQPLIDYILSCHGNQNQYLLDRYRDFRNYVEKQTKKGFHITKEAGIFVCRP
ncbi:methyltransferase domain-containing protein [Catenibacillus scindens]|uniref:MerR family transcriptional regulator n=1 Tax=Catenibacillus scindens TaxID=673271 RepID=UPI00320843CB